MDYWGPFIDQREVYNAARTWQGTAVGDVGRAGQFSALSWPAGDNFPSVADWGYTERGLGYAGFIYGQSTPWLDKLKAVIAQGYPVVCLTDWLPGAYGPHYRVIVGYDDAKGVVYLNDPWCREFKGEIDCVGSFAPNESVQGDKSYGYWAWSYSDFLAVWQLPGDGWGLPGYRYCAALIAPWKVQLSAGTAVNKGARFTVTANVTYPCVAPFGTGGFATFPATGTKVSIAVPGRLHGAERPDRERRRPRGRRYGARDVHRQGGAVGRRVHVRRAGGRPGLGLAERVAEVRRVQLRPTGSAVRRAAASP